MDVIIPVTQKNRPQILAGGFEKMLGEVTNSNLDGVRQCWASLRQHQPTTCPTYEIKLPSKSIVNDVENLKARVSLAIAWAAQLICVVLALPLEK